MVDPIDLLLVHNNMTDFMVSLPLLSLSVLCFN